MTYVLSPFVSLVGPAPVQAPSLADAELECTTLEFVPLPIAPTSGARTELEVGLAPRSESNLIAGFDGVSGVFVATWVELEVGTEVELALHLPAGRVIDVRGRVEFLRNDFVCDGPVGMGVSFVGLNAKDRTVLERFAREREPIFYA